MFSAASFAGVLSAGTTEAQPLSEPPLPSTPVVAFYGFRGGAGRTTSLAHVAALLAARHVHLVAIDLDLEAPGLERVLNCPNVEEGRGGLALLRAASTMGDDDGEVLRLAPHVVKSGLDLGAPIRVLPAGRLTSDYLERLDDLGVPLWHIAEGPSPLELLIDRVKDEIEPQVILLDCRTGLSGLSASAVFHVADVVVCFLPVSVQSLDGLEIVLGGLKAARERRHGAPSIILVPSMVPEGPDGRARLENWFVPAIERRYLELVLGKKHEPDLDDADLDRVPLVREGIEYRRGVALSDTLRTDFVQRAAGTYQGLMRELDGLLKLGVAPVGGKVDARKIVEELKASVNLKSLAFADSTNIEDIVSKFIPPGDFKAILDKSTWYIVGAKGSGKTWMCQYLLSDTGQNETSGQSFIAGHSPTDPLLSANAMRELERDTKLHFERRQLHGTFWLFYAVNRVLERNAKLLDPLSNGLRADERKIVHRLAEATEPSKLQNALTVALQHPRAGTFAEQLIRTLDTTLLAGGHDTITLLYDGLDVGFGSDDAAIAQRGRFIDGLIEALEPLRGTCKRIAFKVFLREDLFSAIRVQNQSHLSAATVELRWEPNDLWALALNLLGASSTYVMAARSIDPSAGPKAWPVEEERRRQLLVPLWGDQLEHGNKVSSANFVQRRTSDGKDRLFPRTLVQLIEAALERQSELEATSDRVLRAAAVIEGYNKASEARVDDLRKEYVALAPYLDGLKGRNPTGTENELIEHLRKYQTKISASRTRKRRGAPAGAIHTGPGGWHKVIERLLEVGVLREYKRAKGDDGQKKYQIALLYRPGLGIKVFGV